MAFGRKTRIYVDSVVYNLAGEEADRPKFLKTTVLASKFNNSSDTTRDIVNAYFRGPGIKLRNFGPWARGPSNYNTTFGNTSGSVLKFVNVDRNVVAGEIPHPVGTIAFVQQVEIAEADYTYWADEYVATHYPNLINTVYTVDMEEFTNTITIHFYTAGVITSSVSFAPTDYEARALYMYALYYEVSNPVTDPLITGATTTLGSGDSFTSTAGWDTLSDDVTTHPVSLDTVTTVDITYSDTTPPSSTSSTTTTSSSYDEVHGVFVKYTPLALPAGQDGIWKKQHTMYQDTTGSVVQVTTTSTTTETIGGVTKTTTTTVVTDTVVLLRTERVDTQNFYYKTWSNIKTFKYKQNTGKPALDVYFTVDDMVGSFLPAIPFRINNVSAHSWGTPAYALAKQAFKKATGGDYDKVLENINNNGSIGDIDYAYAMFGVALNTKDNSSKKYLYEFFKLINQSTTTTEASYLNFKSQWEAADAAFTAWVAWNSSGDRNPLDEPVRLSYPQLPMNSLMIGRSIGTHLNMSLQWVYLRETFGAGLLKPDAKVGDYWFTVGATDNFEEQTWSADEIGFFNSHNWNDTSVTTIYLNHQESETTWSKLEICGLSHKNTIYRGRYVEISAMEALADPEESGFVIPLHEGLYQQFSLVHGTQMAGSSCFLLFNCYKTVRTKWYQTGLFQVVLIIAAVALTIIFPPGGLVAANSVGAIIVSGLAVTGVIGIILTVAINIIVALLVTRMITRASTHMFGDEYGGIIGAVLSVAALAGLNGFAVGDGILPGMAQMMQAPNLLQLTLSVGNAYGAYLGQQTQATMDELNQFQVDYSKKMDEVEAKFNELLGPDSLLNPSYIASVLLSPIEAPETFLQRTLMVGSDIANLSLNMVSDFANITLRTELPT